MEHSKAFTIASWALRLIAAVILLQTLFFKFSGARESVYIFSTLGLEPWGRIGSGVVELIAGIVIVANPDIGYATLAILVGIGFIINGIGLGALGWGLHEARREASRPG